MITRRILRTFQEFRRWDVNAQIGFVIAVVLAVISVVVASNSSGSLRTPATIGAMGSVIAAQLIFMWGNRHMVTPYTQAQRAYIAGDFAAARDILEPLYQQQAADYKMLTLLGNTLRQLGLLDESEAILSEALDKQPNHYFPLFGFGRTLLSKGCYSEAVQAFEKALSNGGEAVIQFDLGEALYRDEHIDAAIPILERVYVHLESEPHRQLMAHYLLFKAGQGDAPSVAMIREGIPYWQNYAELFASTSYGETLDRDVQMMQQMLE